MPSTVKLVTALVTLLRSNLTASQDQKTINIHWTKRLRRLLVQNQTQAEARAKVHAPFQLSPAWMVKHTSWGNGIISNTSPRAQANGCIGAQPMFSFSNTYRTLSPKTPLLLRPICSATGPASDMRHQCHPKEGKDVVSASATNRTEATPLGPD